jgi:alkaline phosphatase
MKPAPPPSRRGFAWLLAAACLAAGLAAGWFLRSANPIPTSNLPGAGRETVALPAASQPAAAPLPPAADAPPRGVVLFMGDGMGLAHLAAARAVLVGPDGRLAIERLPVTGLIATHPAAGLVTKSDAAATALASGHKTVNGRVGADSSGRPLRSIVEVARDQGFATGLVTTAEIVDATPAAFGAHNANRGASEEIAAQLVAARIDVLMGAGASWFLPAAANGRRRDGRDLTAEARAAGWSVARNAEELAAAPGDRLLGLFDFDLGAMAADRPTLAEMTAKALDVLARRPRFLAMIEQEGIDTRSHANSLGSMIAALSALDQAVAATTAAAQRDGGILVLVTADHETGGLSFFDAGAGRLEASWATRQHSGVPVPLFAYGPGAGRFTGLHDNTEISRLIAEVLGIPAPDAG